MKHSYLVLLSLLAMVPVANATPVGSSESLTEVQAAEKKVSGKVVDENGLAMPGVNVFIKGTTVGTITDFDGNFTLSVPSNATIVVSFIGYENEEVAIDGRTDVGTIALKSEFTELEQVVVVGYGSQKKADLTGSVAVVDMDEMKKVSASNMSTMLSGKVAGVSVTSSGEPGADPTVRVRGLSSFGDVSPLYVVDGVPVGTSIRDFSASDIESMQVLKDASAASIYGARGANGVIIITTKHGSKNQTPKIDVRASVGIDNVDKSKVEMCNAKEYQFMANQAMLNDGLDPYKANNPNSEYYIGDVDTKWEDVMFKRGIRQNYNLNLSGGGENSTYNASLDFYDSKGTLEGLGPNYRRYTARLNNTMKVKFIDLQSNLTYSHSNQNSLHLASGGGNNDPMIAQIFFTAPTMSVYNDGRNPLNTTIYGTYDAQRTGETFSRNLLAINNIIDQETQVDRILLSGTIDVDFNELFIKSDDHKVKYRLNTSWDKTLCKDFYWVPKFYMSAFSLNELGTLDQKYRNYQTGLFENTITYDGTIDLHHINVVAGVTFQRDRYHELRGYGEGFDNNDFKQITLASSTKSTTYESEHVIASQLARINYEYDSKYLLQATVRRDGSSRFSKNNRWGTFPSVALGWRISKENFFSVPEEIVNDLKIRASYGVLGNENIGEYAYQETINTNYSYTFGDNKVLGAGTYTIPNTDLKWETKKMLNIGIDATMLDSHLTLTAEYYKSTSSDILLPMSIPYSVGSSSNTVTMNCGELANSGFEFNVVYRNKVNDFNYEVSVNGATLKNEVKDLAVSNDKGIDRGNTLTAVGKEIGRWYCWQFDGLFQNASEISKSVDEAKADPSKHAFQENSTGLGDARYIDQNGDGVINDDDRVDCGSAIPKFTYGINLACDWKGIDFSMFMRGASKFLAYNNLGEMTRHTAGIHNWSVEMLDAWRPDHTNTEIPRVSFANATKYNSAFSDRLLQNAAYLKIANIELGYTFPQELVGKVLSNLRIYASMQNVYTFSKYDGYNADFAGNVWSPGFDNCSFPTPRTVLFGLNLTFK